MMPIVRDYWDCDEWGRFIPGSCVRYTSIIPPISAVTVTDGELREDLSFELREDGSFEIRDAP